MGIRVISRRGFALIASACALQAMLFGDPGFGSLHKRKIELPIRQPAAVRLAHTSMAVKGSSVNPAYLPVQESLTATLETELLSNEKTLIKKENPADAEWVLGLKVTSVSLPTSEQRNQAFGNSNTTYIRWVGSLRAAYQVLDHAGRPHDAGNVESSYDKEFPAGAKQGLGILKKVPGFKKAAQDQKEVPESVEDVKQILIRDIVRQIATKLGNTKKTLGVQVAAGDDRLNRAADFMDKGLWARALEELDKMPAYPRVELEAYRQYDLGLAYEAMSYDASSFKDQRENLFKAQEYYDKALETNQKEKYFIETVARTKDAIARYKAFESMQREDQKKLTPAAPTVVAQNEQSNAPTAAVQVAQPPKPAPAPIRVSQPPAPAVQPPVQPSVQAPKPAAPKQPAPVVQPLKPPAAKPSAAAAKPGAVPDQRVAGPKTLTIHDVIEMFSSGVPQDQILAIIQHSQVQFDPLDKDTAIAIARARLPLALQNEMRKKVGALPLTPVSATNPTAAAPKK